VTAASRWALRVYPPWFRSRYGAELAALADDVGSSWRHTAGLYFGAARAWLRPTFNGPDATRLRLQASVTTVWMAWCGAFLIAPAMTKALVDPPGPHVDTAVRRLLDAATLVLAAGWVIALAGVALIGWRALVPALRARQWAVLLPLLPAIGFGIIDAGGLVALALAARWSSSGPTPEMIAAASIWLASTLAFLAALGIGPNVMIRRLHPDAAALRTPTLLAAMLALCLASLTGLCAMAALIAGNASLVGSFAPVAAVMVVAVVASATALVSSARGVLALHQ
jgi:hypothetical protein